MFPTLGTSEEGQEEGEAEAREGQEEGYGEGNPMLNEADTGSNISQILGAGQ